ncbi:hypothetical protein F0344_31700 [Streptomyces finlayi]|uniref:Uncharacterized protein n=1 Tax=Streptomyces finlayi TaxID=67296 RepID=A0A7G7BTA5_9ACTN|nr:hypothetical protein [Streptomyces finlayi]QNE78570.1 hypothetical protein F0344_31700 [Streptomyces finlayi]
MELELMVALRVLDHDSGDRITDRGPDHRRTIGAAVMHSRHVREGLGQLHTLHRNEDSEGRDFLDGAVDRGTVRELLLGGSPFVTCH